MNPEKKSKVYPTALPHRPPEASAPLDKRPSAKPVDAPEPGPEATPGATARSRVRGGWIFALGLVALLGIAGGLAVWWEKNTVEPPDVEHPTAVPANRSEDGSPSTPIKSEAFARAKAKIASLKLANPPAKSVAKAQASAPASEAYLEALGSLTAAHLYQTYVNIGMLADAVESEQVTLDEAEKTLANIVRLMTLVENQLDQITKLDLDPNDRKALEKVQTHAQTLRRQTTALRAYWEKGEAEQITAFHAARTEAWLGIREMLGLDDTEMDLSKQADAKR